ncbi:soluble scavenger receptor cysteine-rich domain-containing protein SSC5D-like, partial [Pyrgilauda ruficollis]|uniref:soluble scavenger receptor cysteine-rich domain-containing protein SSC5D-like n=1 Tax=Pyrgilauda ruficollis TaxID=221976 RepID=UPI001B87DAB8
VRLADGPGACAGRVEVLHLGRWGTVCDDTWAFPAAAVVCRYLGCGQVIAAPPRARFGPGRGQVWLDGLTCTGEEAAPSECRHKGWGVHTCEHSEDASVVCAGERRTGGTSLNGADIYSGCGTLKIEYAKVRPQRPQVRPCLTQVRPRHPQVQPCRPQVRPRNPQVCPQVRPRNPQVTPAPHLCPESALPALPQVRLSGAPDRCAGRVEVRHAHLWGTVCDDTWGLREARVLCAHLRCGPALEAPGGARYGQGEGPIWLDDVTCSGEEPDFFRCAHRTWGEHNCHHGEDAGVVCA